MIQRSGQDRYLIQASGQGRQVVQESRQEFQVMEMIRRGRQEQTSLLSQCPGRHCFGAVSVKWEIMLIKLLLVSLALHLVVFVLLVLLVVVVQKLVVHLICVRVSLLVQNNSFSCLPTLGTPRSPLPLLVLTVY